MDSALGIESTGNRKCWHVIDTRDMVIEHERLTLNQARQMSHVPHRTYCRDGFKLVQCDGEAHDNPHIDNCMQCAPRWGWLMVPANEPKLADAQMDSALGIDDYAPPALHAFCKTDCGLKDCPQRPKPELTHVEKTLLGALK